MSEDRISYHTKAVNLARRWSVQNENDLMQVGYCWTVSDKFPFLFLLGFAYGGFIQVLLEPTFDISFSRTFAQCRKIIPVSAVISFDFFQMRRLVCEL